MTCPPLRIRVQSPIAGSPKRVLELAGPSVVVGRSRAVQVQLPGADVSGAHARLQWTADGLRVEDLGSVNGTRAGERSLTPGRTYPLAWGEPLYIADYVLTVLDPAAESAAGLSGEAGTGTLAAHLVRDMAEGRDAARLRVWDRAGHERQISLAPGQRLRLGRGPGCQVRLADPDLSRDHAEIHMAAEGATLRDLGSKNSVTVNGMDWTETGPLRHGDVIRLGSCKVRYEDPAEALLAELNRPLDKDEPVDEPDLSTGLSTGPDTGPGLTTDPLAPAPGRLGLTLLIVLGLALMGAAVYLLLWLFA